MLKHYLLFIRGLAANWIGTIGVVLATAAFITFLVVEVLRALEIVTSTLIGLVSYMTLPALFVFGLLLVLLGWWRLKRKTGKTLRDLIAQRFPGELQEKGIIFSRLGRIFLLVALASMVFLGAGGTRMAHFMDSAEFCGTACHQVMHPEWETHQKSAHARVKCVECHVGQGMEAQLEAKLNGLWQIISASMNLYQKPIPTPVHNLRPARETCERCHWPEKFYGDRIKIFHHYQEDRNSTPTYSTISLKVDSGKKDGEGSIHWHIDKANQVDYLSLGHKRDQMLEVKVRQPDGSFRTFKNRLLEGQTSTQERRTLDCVDCHNRATHIYEMPEKALDKRLASGELDRSLPFVKRTAYKALRREYKDKEAAMLGIDQTIRGFYSSLDESTGIADLEKIDQVVQVVQEIYNRNIHPGMNVNWGAYPDHRGHSQGRGCFRCHHRNLVDENGRSIRYDCTLCHSILSNQNTKVFKYLEQPKKGDPEAVMHRYLRHEFMDKK